MSFRTRNFVAMWATMALLGAGTVAVALHHQSKPADASLVAAKSKPPRPNYVTTRMTPGGPVYGYEAGQELIEVAYTEHDGIRTRLSTDEELLIFLSDLTCDAGVVTAGRPVVGGIIADKTIRLIRPGTPLAAMCADARAGLLRPHKALADVAVA